MKPEVKLMLGAFLIGLCAIGGEIAYRYHANHTDDTARTAAPATDPDDLVFLRQEHPRTLADVKDLKGKPVWVAAGGQLDYFPAKGTHIDFSKNEGVLHMTEKLQVEDAIEQPTPARVQTRVPKGVKQVFLLVSLPNEPAAAGQTYAVPVGDQEAGGDLALLDDQIFFYDDPHKLFNYWSPQVWQAIDQHKAIVGMTERQAQTAFGPLSEPVGDSVGNRTVKYFNDGHPVTVTFANGKATKVDQG